MLGDVFEQSESQRRLPYCFQVRLHSSSGAARFAHGQHGFLEARWSFCPASC